MFIIWDESGLIRHNRTVIVWYCPDDDSIPSPCYHGGRRCGEHSGVEFTYKCESVGER